MIPIKNKTTNNIESSVLSKRGSITLHPADESRVFGRIRIYIKQLQDQIQTYLLHIG